LKNHVSLIGNLGFDPELKTAGSTTVCNLRVATTDKWRDKATGELKEETEWHNVEVWGKLGETCAKNLRKGHLVGVEGRNKTEKWDDKVTGAKRERTKVVADRVHFLNRAGRSGGGDDAGELDGSPIPVE
jgi:single-strand DNA-binding protein